MCMDFVRLLHTHVVCSQTLNLWQKNQIRLNFVSFIFFLDRFNSFPFSETHIHQPGPILYGNFDMWCMNEDFEILVCEIVPLVSTVTIQLYSKISF